MHININNNINNRLYILYILTVSINEEKYIIRVGRTEEKKTHIHIKKIHNRQIHIYIYNIHPSIQEHII